MANLSHRGLPSKFSEGNPHSFNKSRTTKPTLKTLEKLAELKNVYSLFGKAAVLKDLQIREKCNHGTIEERNYLRKAIESHFLSFPDHNDALSPKAKEKRRKAAENAAKEKEVTALSSIQGHFSQPTKIDHLPLTYDVVQAWAIISKEKKEKGGAVATMCGCGSELYHSEDWQRLEYGKFSLVPDWDVQMNLKKGDSRSYNRRYLAYHVSKSDAIAEVYTHHKKSSDRIGIRPFQHVIQSPSGLSLCADLLDEIGYVKTGISYTEIKGFSAKLQSVLAFIHKHEATKKNAKPASATANGLPTVQIGEGRRVGDDYIIDPNGDPLTATVGHKSSSRRFTVYQFGKTAKKRRKQAQIDFAIDNEAIASEKQLGDLYAIEARLKGAELKRVMIPDGNGGKRAVQGLRDLSDPATMKAIFRTQIETGFNFQVEDPADKNKPKSKRKKIDLEFFDWDKIEAKVFTRARRKQSLAYSAKQAVKRLTLDSRKGDYLVKGLAPRVEKEFERSVFSASNVDALVDTISATGGGDDSGLLKEIVTTWGKGAVMDSSATIARRFIIDTSEIIAQEYEVVKFHHKCTYALSKLPTVDRLPESLKAAA